MTRDSGRAARFARVALEFAGSARFAQALALITVGFAFSTHAIRALIGWPGLLAALAGLLALCAASLVARWRAVEWYGSFRSRSSCSWVGAWHR